MPSGTSPPPNQIDFTETGLNPVLFPCFYFTNRHCFTLFCKPRCTATRFGFHDLVLREELKVPQSGNGPYSVHG